MMAATKLVLVRTTFKKKKDRAHFAGAVRDAWTQKVLVRKTKQRTQHRTKRGQAHLVPKRKAIRTKTLNPKP
jgi:hypothetical protein